MKMLKKLLAVVLTGAMALTLLTACGSNAVTEKNIADAMTDLAKTQNSNATFIPRAKERELARNFAALAESKAADGKDIFDNDDGKTFAEERKNILGCNQGNADNFVWAAGIPTDKFGNSAQAFGLLYQTVNGESAQNYDDLKGKNMEPADERYMGTALCKMLDDNGNLVTVRIIVVTAKAEVDKDKG